MESKSGYINVRGKLIDLGKPRIMGVINITPDSFYSGSRYSGANSVSEAVSRMISDGADFIDIGGCSSRPGAETISVEEERSRIMDPIRLITSEMPDVIISVDTFRSEIAREAIRDCGAHMINDISGGEADPGMFSLVAELNVPYVLMHMQGTPSSMQQNPQYEDVVSDLLKWFGKKLIKLQSAGVKDIIIDPGFGFGKTIAHNFEILRRLRDFSITGMPLLAGLSRKSMIWKTLETSPDDALTGTSVLNMVALMNGADILRVHDVKQAADTIKLYERLKAGTKYPIHKS
jgi:dihydropteroate synthase